MTKPTKPQFTVRPTAYRAWDGRKMVDVQTLSWNAGGMLWHGAGGQMGWAWINPEYKGWDANNPKLGEGDIRPVMQWTGLKDKSGVDIYEGDIVRITPPFQVVPKSFGIVSSLYLVEWTGRDFQFKSLVELPVMEGCGYSERVVHVREVVGNIFQNPDLLES